MKLAEVIHEVEGKKPSLYCSGLEPNLQYCLWGSAAPDLLYLNFYLGYYHLHARVPLSTSFPTYNSVHFYDSPCTKH